MRKQLLKDVRPDLAAQVFDKTLLDTLASSDRRKIMWQCDKGHTWDALVSNRVSKGYGCPYCSGRLAIPGVTDLATTNPDIAAQLVDTSLAFKLKATSHTAVMWKCEQGHVWEASVSSRVAKDSGCPYCSGRLAIAGVNDLATTHPDLAAQLVDATLATKLMKGSNRKVMWRCEHGHTWLATPNSRKSADSGCPYCSGRLAIAGVSDLASQRPDIAAMLEDAVDATTISVYSNRKYRWRCEHGHVWTAPVSRLTYHNSGCPVCAGKKVVAGVNDLATVRPDMAQQLVDSNVGHNLRPKSHKKVTWQCDKGHTWDAIVSNRVAFGYGCPICGSRHVTSAAEYEVANYVQELVQDATVVRNCRTFLPNRRELDIVVPDLRVAVEFNGVWWHSLDNIGSITYHADKTAACRELGYRLFHVWEDDWTCRRPLVERYLRKFVLGETRIDNKSFTCDRIDSGIASEFVESNHLRGYVNSVCNIGLYNDDYTLVAVLCGNVLDTDSCFHVTRFAAIDGDTQCLDKLLHYIASEFDVNIVTISSYNDFDRSEVYVNNGFVVDNYVGPVCYVMSGAAYMTRNIASDETHYESSISIFDSGMVKWKRLL